MVVQLQRDRFGFLFTGDLESLGEHLLLQSKARRPYWNLSIQFLTQKTQAFCGVASIVMVLNALVLRPIPPSVAASVRAFARELGVELLVHVNREGLARGIVNGCAQQFKIERRSAMKKIS